MLSRLPMRFDSLSANRHYSMSDPRGMKNDDGLKISIDVGLPRFQFTTATYVRDVGMFWDLAKSKSNHAFYSSTGYVFLTKLYSKEKFCQLYGNACATLQNDGVTRLVQLDADWYVLFMYGDRDPYPISMNLRCRALAAEK